jgi:Tol biopolymer transport system component
MDADGAGQRQIPDDVGGMMSFDWFPDGLSLLYERGSRGLWSVSRGSLRQGFDMPVPFGEPSLVSDVNCQLPRWAPDGSAIVCNGPSTWGDHLTLFWLSPQGTVIRQWPHLPYDELQREQFAGMRGEEREPPQFWWMRYPRYSPDGSTIYFFGMDNASGTGSGFNRGVFSMPAGGGQPRLVVSLDDPSLEVWAPLQDGTRFAALSVGEEHIYLSVADSESDIWVIDLDW